MNLVPISELFSIEKGSVQSSKCTPGQNPFLTAADEWKTHNDYSHDCEALVFAAAASGSLGRTHYVNGKFIASDLCYILKPKNPEKYPINQRFYHFVFNALRQEIVQTTKSGTSKESINQKSFNAYKLPYFGINKQEMWIEKLVYVRQASEDLSIEITHQQDLLKKLRQQILQDAISGKLTAEWRKKNPHVEPASELLKRIQAEKVKLGIKQKPLPAIRKEEIPFELPEGWVWCRLGEVIENLQYGTAQKCDYETQGTAVLRIPNVSGGTISLDDLKYASLSKKEIDYYALFKNDILIIRSNGSPSLVGRPTLVTNNAEGCAFAGYLIRIQIKPRFALPNYIYNVLNSSYIRNIIEPNLRTTTGVKNINSNEIFRLPIPLPPLNEQKHIIEKIASSFEIADVLNDQISLTYLDATSLLQSILKEAFEA